MKKILLLGGARQQIPSIIAAKKLGFYTVTCDYLPDNPGHRYADEYYNVSTTDKDAVLKLAKKLKIDGIACYASDPSATTAAYVAEKMHLPGNHYESVEILSNKAKYRHFLSQNGFCSPKAEAYSSFEEVKKGLSDFKLPVFVKPVDSSGSKGIALIRDLSGLKKMVETALSFSRAKEVIVEEYVESVSYQIAGDGFSVDGSLLFRCFGNDHFDRSNLSPFVPAAASFPCTAAADIQNKVHSEIQRLLSLLDMKTGAYNFDVRLDDRGNVYLMEVGPRNGGCYIPQVIKYSTGVDMVEYTIKASMGEDCSGLEHKKPNGFWSYYAVHSPATGRLKAINIDEGVNANNVVEKYFCYESGEIIHPYTSSDKKLGVLLMKFASMEEMLDMMDNTADWLRVDVERI